METTKNQALPKSFQAILWSQNIRSFDIEKDKAQIIHHVLAYGGLDEIKRLYKIYSPREIEQVFIKRPMKLYTPASFEFILKSLLGKSVKFLSPRKYVKAVY